MSVERRGKKWRVRYLDGDRHRSRTFDLKADAQAFDQETRRRKQRGTLHRSPSPRKPWTRTSPRRGRPSTPPCSLPPAASSTRGRTTRTSAPRSAPCRCTRSRRRSSPAGRPGSSPSELGHETIRKARQVLSGILRTAVETELLDRNPVAAVRAPAAPMRDEPTVLAPARVEAIRAACSPRGAAMVSVLAYAGLRPQEARELRWGDVKERTLIASARKTRRRRSVRLLEPLAQDLREWRMRPGAPPTTRPCSPAATAR